MRKQKREDNGKWEEYACILVAKTLGSYTYTGLSNCESFLVQQQQGLVLSALTSKGCNLFAREDWGKQECMIR